jgi:hypothetical protein
MSSSGEVVVVLIGLMLQTLMGQIAAGSPITPQDIIRRVTAQGNAAGIRLGEVLCFYAIPLIIVALQISRR